MNYKIKRQQYFEIWGEALKLYMDNLLPLVILALIGSIPILLLSAIQPVASLDPETSVDPMKVMVWLMLLLTSNSLSQGMILEYVSKRYLNVKLNFGQYMETVLTIVVPILGLSLAISVIVSIGFMAFVLPGIFLTLALSLAMEVLVVERTPIQMAISRSFFLTKDRKGEIFFLTLIFTLLSFGLDKILRLVLSTMNLSQLPINPEYIILMITQLVLAPMGACLFILIYFNMRIEKEGFSVEQLKKKEFIG